MRNPGLPVALALAAVLILVPLPSQLRVRNVAVLIMITGTFLINVIYLVNTLLWAGNVRDVAPVWCDITTNFQSYYSLLGVGAALCTCKHLGWVSSKHSTVSGRPHRVLFEVALCCVLPLVSIPIRYALSSNRYIILEGLGCLPLFYISPIAVAFSIGPSLAVALVGFVFACIAARNLIRHRASTLNSTSKHTLTTSRFIRLLMLCVIAGLWPVLAVLLCLRHLALNLLPWPGWAIVHAHFNDIPRIPLFAQPPQLRLAYTTIIWVVITTSYLTFAILACTEDMREDFRKVGNFVVRKVSWHGGVRQRTVTAPPSKWFDSSSTNRSKHNPPMTLVALKNSSTVPGNSYSTAETL